MRIVAIALLLFLAGCTGVVPDFGTTIPDPDAPSASGAVVVCPTDVKVCPNGATVGRVPPSCAFAVCPIISEGATYVSDVPAAPAPGVAMVCDYTQPGYSYLFTSKAGCSGRIIECPSGQAFYNDCGCGCTVPVAAVVPTPAAPAEPALVDQDPGGFIDTEKDPEPDGPLGIY